MVERRKCIDTHPLYHCIVTGFRGSMESEWFHIEVLYPLYYMYTEWWFLLVIHNTSKSAQSFIVLPDLGSFGREFFSAVFDGHLPDIEARPWPHRAHPEPGNDGSCWCRFLQGLPPSRLQCWGLLLEPIPSWQNKHTVPQNQFVYI